MPGIERPSKENKISQACYLSRIMHALNDRYFDKDLSETTRERLGLISTYIYAVGDKALRKHRQKYLDQFPIATLDILIKMPSDQIANAAINDMDQLPQAFVRSTENLVSKASKIHPPPNEDDTWEDDFKQHVINWQESTGITPQDFGLTETESKTTRLSKISHLLSPLLSSLPQF